jgi:FKBP-type peptidyl-prolyl cis-trans isomerase
MVILDQGGEEEMDLLVIDVIQQPVRTEITTSRFQFELDPDDIAGTGVRLMKTLSKKVDDTTSAERATVTKFPMAAAGDLEAVASKAEAVGGLLYLLSALSQSSSSESSLAKAVAALEAHFDHSVKSSTISSSNGSGSSTNKGHATLPVQQVLLLLTPLLLQYTSGRTTAEISAAVHKAAYWFQQQGKPQGKQIDSKSPATPTPTPATNERPSREECAAFLARNKTLPGVVTTATGLQYKVLQSASSGGGGGTQEAALGELPMKSTKCEVHYTGTLVNGVEFDTSDVPETGEYDTSVFAPRQVIKGTVTKSDSDSDSDVSMLVNFYFYV